MHPKSTSMLRKGRLWHDKIKGLISSFLLIYPRREKSEYVAECEKDDKSDDDIHCPSFCLLRVLFTFTSE